MARPKDDLSRVSINQLATLTGSHYRAITKILSQAGIQELATDGNSRFFDPKEALPAIFEAQGHRARRPSLESPSTPDPDDIAKLLDPGIQNARLAAARTRKVEIEIEIMLKKYVPAEDVEKVWTDMIMASKAKLRSLGSRVAPRLLGLKDVVRIEEEIEREIYAAMSELKDYEAEQYHAPGEAGDEPMGPTTETDDQ